MPASAAVISVDQSKQQQPIGNENDDDDAEQADTVAEGSGVPCAPGFSAEAYAAPRPAAKARSQSVSSSSAPTAPPAPTMDPPSAPSSASSSSSASSASSLGASLASRSGLLSAIQSQPRLRRSSEQHVLAERKPVVDLNSELTWAIRRKQKMDPSVRDAAQAVKTLPDAARHSLLELVGRILRCDATGPASLETIERLLEDREVFVRTHASVLGASAQALEQVEPTWPTVRFEVLSNAKRAQLKVMACLDNTRKYTVPFEEHRARILAMQQRANGSGDSSSSSSASSTAPLSSSSSDWLIVDSQILHRSMGSLQRSLEDLQRLQRDAEGIANLGLAPTFTEGSSALAALVDLLFEKCCLSYAPTSANMNSVGEGGAPSLTAASSLAASSLASSSSAASSGVLVPHHSQTSRSIRAFQTLDLALDMFSRVSGGAHPLVQFDEAQHALKNRLAQLKRDIEAAPGYKASGIAVAQRKGQWDQKEEVVLRSTSASASSSSSSSASGSSSATARPSGHGTSAAALDRALAEFKQAHPRLVAILEKKAAASKVNGGKFPVTAAATAAMVAAAPSSSSSSLDGGLDDDDSASSASVFVDPEEAELATLLAGLSDSDTPLSMLALLLVRLTIPAHDAASFRIFVTHALLPRRPSSSGLGVGSDAQATTAAAATPAEWEACGAQILHECVAKSWTDGVRMCLPATDDEVAPLPTLGLDANLRLSTLASGVGSAAAGSGLTALHVAAAALNLPLVCVLIARGANPLAINSFERTPLFSLRQLFVESKTLTLLATGNTANTGGSSGASGNPNDGLVSVDASSSSNAPSALMARYYKSPRLSDVVLRLEIFPGSSGLGAGHGQSEAPAEVQEVFAHRLVLCAQSEVFRVMMDDQEPQSGVTSAWAEAAQFSSSSSASSSATAASSAGDGGLDDDDAPVAGQPRRSGPPVVTLSDIPSLGSFELLLRFLYSGCCLFVNDGDLALAAQVLALATRLLVEPLRTAMQIHLAAPQRMLPANIDSLYNLALHTNAHLLQRRIEHFVVSQYASIVAQRPSLAQRSMAPDGSTVPPHAFLMRVLAGLDVAEMLAAQGTGNTIRWRV